MTWRHLDGGRPPTDRVQSFLLIEPDGDGLILDGGADVQLGTGRSDAWTRSLSSPSDWTMVAADTGANGGAVALDDAANRLVAFGGATGETGGGLVNTVWISRSAAGSAWQALPVHGDPPVPRAAALAIYDHGRDRLIVTGGYGWGDGDFADCSALSLGGSPTWTPLPPLGLQVRTDDAIAFEDRQGQRMLVLVIDDLTERADVYALSLDGAPSWSKLAIVNGLPHALEDRYFVFDPEKRRILALGDPSELGAVPDLWSLAVENCL
jgi:hypothetical protein